MENGQERADTEDDTEGTGRGPAGRMAREDERGLDASGRGEGSAQYDGNAFGVAEMMLVRRGRVDAWRLSPLAAPPAPSEREIAEEGGDAAPHAAASPCLRAWRDAVPMGLRCGETASRAAASVLDSASSSSRLVEPAVGGLTPVLPAQPPPPPPDQQPGGELDSLDRSEPDWVDWDAARTEGCACGPAPMAIPPLRCDGWTSLMAPLCDALPRT